MADHAEQLRKLAAILDDVKQELQLARIQCLKPKHLSVRVRRAVVQAARAVAAAVDLELFEIDSPLSWILSSLRNPDDPDRRPVTMQSGELKGELRSITFGSGCNPDGTLRDDTAFELWTKFICPVMRGKRTLSKANAGAFDFPEVITDEQGRVLGRNGKPLERIEKTDPETGELTGWELQGPEARVTDHYDNVDAMEHLRCQAADWADICDVAADLIRSEASLSEEPNRQPESPIETRRKQLADGIHEPNLLVYYGREAEIQPTPWRFLKYMWDRERATVTAVQDYISTSDSGLKSAISRANGALENLGVPISFGTKSGYVVRT